MQSKIKMVKIGKQVKVYFSYNPDLVQIMRRNGGWWWHKDKCWSFPVGQTSEIYDQLREEGYLVDIKSEKEKPKTKVEHKLTLKERFKNPDVVSVYATCKHCKQGNFVGKDELCSVCRNKLYKKSKI